MVGEGGNLEEVSVCLGQLGGRELYSIFCNKLDGK